MTTQDIIKTLGGWQGYNVSTAGLSPGDGAEVWIELRRDFGPGNCSVCGTLCSGIHDMTERWVQDLPVFGKPCRLLVQRCRVWCPTCGGPKVEALDWLDPWSRYTSRFAASVARMCKVATHKHVAEEYGIDRKTVKTIDKRHIEAELGPVDLSDVRQIVMDEFAIQKGHRYATVIVEARRKEVLWVGRGNGREDIRPFFEMLGEDGRKRVEAVAMDMNGSFVHEVQSQCPQAEIVYDLFHVVAKYGREVIDRVRVDEANRLKSNKGAREVIKGARWLLLRNAENIKKRKDRVRLKELLNANKKIATVYVLKDDLKHLWDYAYPGAALRFWEQWYSRAIRSRIEPLKEFARKLKKYLYGIVSHCRFPLHTSLIEGINNKIKVIKRMAYGYRDDEYFFLKIRQAFPGNGS